MKKIPELGTKVRYTGNCEMFKGAVGVVTKIYEPFHDEGFSAAVTVLGELPEEWPYIGSDSFAPNIEEIEPEQAQ